MTPIRVVSEATALKNGFKVASARFFTNKSDATIEASILTKRYGWKTIIARSTKRGDYDKILNGYRIFSKSNIMKTNRSKTVRRDLRRKQAHTKRNY